jgi:hypothetical protein
MMETPLALDFEKAGRGGVTLSHHIDHCLGYLRQAIMCAADPTVESLTRTVDKDGQLKKSDEGWGNVHVCRSWDALKEYATSHAPVNASGLGVKMYIQMAANPGFSFREDVDLDV